MSHRKRFPLGRYARPEGGWGCPRAASLWFDRVADDLRAMLDGVKELARQAHHDDSTGRAFGEMIDKLFGVGGLWFVEHILEAAVKVADDVHPANGLPSGETFPPAAAAEPHPWGDPDRHPIPTYGRQTHPVYQLRPTPAAPTVLGMPVVGEIDSADLKRLFDGETVDSPGLRAVDEALTGHKVNPAPKAKPAPLAGGGHRVGKLAGV